MVKGIDSLPCTEVFILLVGRLVFGKGVPGIVPYPTAASALKCAFKGLLNTSDLLTP